MLINAKLRIPPLRERMLLRKHLLERLSAGEASRLILINGTAGSGKTSLVCQWIGERKRRVAWYSLDETDNDPDFFFRYFLTALSSIDPRLESDVGPWVYGQKRLVASDIIARLMDYAIDLHEDLYLVLDDYHVITSQRIHDALAHLLNQELPRIHLIVISRYSVPLPLSRLKVRNRMVAISSEEMKFSYKETEQFFREIIPVALSTGQVQELTRHMEGWVGGLQLFGLSLRGKETVETLSNVLNRACEDAADYLIDEVVTIQTEKTRTFLYTTALLGRFNADLCREVTGISDSRGMLDHLHRNNLFLIPLDDDGMWWRYHHLFSRAVTKKAQILSDENCRQVYRKAALWFAKNGYFEDAFRQAFESGDVEFAADMLEDYLMVLYERYEIASFRRWLLKLPRDVFARRALLRLFDCRFRIDSLQLSEVPAILKDIEARKDEGFSRYQGNKRKLCEDFLVIFSHTFPHLLDFEHTDISSFQNAHGHFSLESWLSSWFLTNISFAHFHKGRMHLAAGAIERASEAVFASGNLTSAMIWFRVAATIERFQGHLNRSEKILHDAYRFFTEKGLLSAKLRFMLDLQWAWIFYQRNDLNKAREYALTVSRYVEQTRFLFEVVDVNYLLALISVAMNEDDKVDRYLQRIRSAAQDLGMPSLIALTEAYAARLYVARQDVIEAEKWLKKRNLSLGEPFSLRFVTECLAWADVLSFRSSRRDALAILDNLRGLCAQQGMAEAVLEIDILRAANLYELHDRHTARSVMREALRFSEAEGYIRPFVTYSQAISSVLADMAFNHSQTPASRKRNPHLDMICNACGLDDTALTGSSDSPARGPADLTRRETEILELMGAGYRDKEIAEKIFVSLNTVRTHTRHILGKLEAKSRLQAIRRMEELSAGRR
jgi:LuxR family transcriptional regulator, maltose regulon positive regulatory protein